MLCITMRKGDYFKIGDDIVIRFDHLSSERVHLSINAPREVPIVRGKVLERTGGERPDCVFEAPRRHRQEISWNRGKTRTVSAMRSLLSQMDGENDEVRTLRRQLDSLFPPGFLPSGDEAPQK